MEDNNGQRSSTDQSTQFVAIDELTENVLSKFAGQIELSKIRVDKDLPHLSADVYPRFIHAAVSQLIENAIEQMPDGGDLNVTLIEGDRCWELEVADSVPIPQPAKRNPPPNTTGSMILPVILGIQQRSKLELARRAAMVHGGHIQTWDCPQGGTANVLVIPRRQECRKSA